MEIEAVTGQADVVGEIGVAVGAAQDAVLPDDRALLLGREPAETAGAAQRVPDGPRPRRVQRRAARAAQQPLVQVRFEARRVGPAEHGELGLRGQRGEGLGVQQLAQAAHEEGRVLAHRQHRDPARIVGVLVQDGLDAARLEGP